MNAHVISPAMKDSVRYPSLSWCMYKFTSWFLNVHHCQWKCWPDCVNLVVNSVIVLPNTNESQHSSVLLPCVQETIRNTKKHTEKELDLLDVNLWFGAYANLWLQGMRKKTPLRTHGCSFVQGFNVPVGTWCWQLSNAGISWAFLLKADHTVLLDMVPQNLLGNKTVLWNSMINKRICMK